MATADDVIDYIAPFAPVVLINADGSIISGTAEANAKINIDLTNDGSFDETVTADGSGNWSFSPTTAVAPGDTINVTAEDAAGNVSDATTNTFADSSTVADLVSDSTTITGGNGTGDVDTLTLGFGSITLDLTAIDNANITDIERIDITGDSANSLIITAADVLDLSSTSDEVIVLGDAGDTVDATGFSNTGTTLTIDAQDFDVYESGGATLIVDQDIMTTV